MAITKWYDNLNTLPAMVYAVRESAEAALEEMEALCDSWYNTFSAEDTAELCRKVSEDAYELKLIAKQLVDMADRYEDIAEEVLAEERGER